MANSAADGEQLGGQQADGGRMDEQQRVGAAEALEMNGTLNIFPFSPFRHSRIGQQKW